MKKLSVGKDVAYIALFAALTVVCSWLYIPTPVPFTLQTFALFAAVCMLGTRKGFLVACTYLAMGFIGVPVFSGFQGGFSALFGATGGYLIGYFVGGLLMCAVDVIPIKKGKKLLTLGVGQLAYYACGVAWYSLVYVQGSVGVFSALLICVVPFLLPDAAKIVLARYLSRKLSRLVPRMEKTRRVKNVLYLLSAAELTEEVFEKWYDKMPEARKAKINALQFDKDKRLSLAAGVLLYTAAKKYGFAMTDIYVGEAGKPYCEKEGVYFSLSHSDEYAVLALSSAEVGVDIERVRNFSAPLIDKAFTTEEKSQAQADEDTYYTTLWTMKESLVKYKGTGLKGGLREVQVSQVAAEEGVRFTGYNLDGYALTVCSQKSPFSKKIEKLSAL